MYSPLPDGLDDMPPGPELSALLDSVDLSLLNGHQLVQVLAARNRQLSYEYARMLEVARELCYTPACTEMAPPARTAEPDPRIATEVEDARSRWVEHSEYANGTAALSGSYLAKDRAAAAWENIDRIARATKAGGDQRTLHQIRADVFADLLAGVDPTLAGAATPAPRTGVINLTIGLSTLACLDDLPADIDGFGPVLADIARQTAAHMADTAQWRFTVLGNHGHTLAEGRLCYQPTLTQQHFIRARDITCQAPGCRQPATCCDIDHIRDWAHHGTTHTHNLCALCRRHHSAKHIAGHHLQRTTHGIEWTTPRAHRYTVLPHHTPAPTPTEHHLDHRIRGHHTISKLRR